MKKKLREAVVVAYGRTPVSRAKKGYFTGIHPIEWGAQALVGVLKKVPQLDPNEIDDVIIGCARTVNKCSKNVARLICLRAGLESVSAQTVNRFCSSGLQTISIGANAIAVGDMDVVVAGGIESMSMVQTPGEDDEDPVLGEMNPGAYMGMGITAENCVKRFHLTRQQMDSFSVKSHQKAVAAQAAGYLNKSIIPIKIRRPDGEEIVAEMDQGIRPESTLEVLSTLKPSFTENGTVTAGNSSQTNDAAAFVVLMSREKAEYLGLKPIAKLVSYAVAGCDPCYMGLGPIYAVPKAMKIAGLKLEDMDVIELNEAFAAQSIPCIETLHMDSTRVNPWGGAISLGHPMGATGTILTIKALDYLQIKGGKYALVTMCIGGGQGAAGIFEMIETI